jgi:hypothetical protein
MNGSTAKILLILLLSCGLTTSSQAQLINRVFEQKDSLIPNDTQTVRLHVELFNYYRNTEYFDLIEKGQTYFGSLLQMHVSLQPFKNIMVKGGLQTRQDYGSTSISIQPVLSVSIFKNRWRYNFGMLQGTTNYGMIEPMYNIDKAIVNRIENGIQGIYKSRTFYFNNFLVWNEPTYRTSTNQERFTIGIVSNRLLFNNKTFYISWPAQGTLAHRGGQLNGNPNPIYSRVNVATGLKLNVRINPRFTIRTENYFLHSQDFSPSITQPYKNGNASWHTLAFDYKRVELMFNYWAGREYQSPVGTQIYNNYNFYNVYEFRQARHMLMARLMYTQAVYKGLFIDARVEPFYDYEYKQFQYSYSFYLRLNLDKVLGKLSFD